MAAQLLDAPSIGHEVRGRKVEVDPILDALPLSNPLETHPQSLLPAQPDVGAGPGHHIPPQQADQNEARSSGSLQSMITCEIAAEGGVTLRS